MIKFEHTVFALPFALLGALAGAQGFPGWRCLGWILAAMVGARTAAMTFNRLADQDLDAANPRTASRALPAGRVSRSGATVLLGLSVVLFGFSAGMLGPLPWKLAPVALAVLLGYSFCKRFTTLSHIVLGLALAAGIGTAAGIAAAWFSSGAARTAALLLAAAPLFDFVSAASASAARWRAAPGPASSAPRARSPSRARSPHSPERRRARS